MRYAFSCHDRMGLRLEEVVRDFAIKNLLYGVLREALDRGLRPNLWLWQGDILNGTVVLRQGDEIVAVLQEGTNGELTLEC